MSAVTISSRLATNNAFRILTIVTALRKCPLFANVSDEILNQVADICVAKTLDKGDYLFHEEAPVHGFYVVQTGAIKLHRVNANGKENVIHVFRINEIVGAEALFSDSGYYADASATESSRVILVQRPAFIELMKLHPDLVSNLVKTLGLQFRLLLALLGDLASENVETRVARWLIQQCPDSESEAPWTVHLSMTKHLLAIELGTVSETLSRTFAKLRSKKLLAINEREITLLCPVKLSRFLQSK